MSGIEIPRYDPEDSILESIEALGRVVIAAITGKRWTSWTGTYAKMDKAELIRKMRAAMAKIKFMPPRKTGD